MSAVEADDSSVLLEHDGEIATIVLNKPERLNALDRAMWRRVGALCRGLEADDDLRCIVFRGAGGKAFAAGADIAAFAHERSNLEQARAYHDVIVETMSAVAECRHPTLALIEGVCVGGGLEIAACMDMRICGQSSRFGVPINKLGLTMGFGELRGLLDLVGPAATKEILLEGAIFDAERALRMGLVNRIVPDDKVAEESYATARRIAKGAPLAARWHKQFIGRLADPTPLREAEIAEGFASMGTEDFQEGYKAFLEKRKPVFKGR